MKVEVRPSPCHDYLLVTLAMEPFIVNAWLKICDISSSLGYNVLMLSAIIYFHFSPFAFDFRVYCLS